MCDADVKIRRELLDLVCDRGLVTAAALREGRQPLDVVPPTGKADQAGRDVDADGRVRGDPAVGVDAGRRDASGFQELIGKGSG